MSKTIFTYHKLLKAYLDCRKCKRSTLSALNFEINMEENLYQLTQQLQKNTYQPQRSVYFVVTQPKPREIFAAEFADRITHHLLINEVEKIWEKNIFIADSYACRQGKGNHRAMQRVSKLAAQYQFYGQFDLSNFFSSIDKDIVFQLFSQVIQEQRRPQFWKDEILRLARTIIFADPTKDYLYKGDPQLKQRVPKQKSLFEQEENIGMPIGNLSSQFLANVYLHELDYFATNTLKVPGYIRYVDDFLILSNSKAEIIAARDKIKIFLLKKLRLTLHPKKQQIQPTRHGIPFVGYYIKPNAVTVRRNVVKRVKNMLYQHEGHALEADTSRLAASLNSYYGHFMQAHSYTLRRHLYEQHIAADTKTKLRPVANWRYFRLVEKRVKKQNWTKNRKK